MHRDILKSIHDMSGYALDALAKGDTLTARRWIKEMNYHSSDAYLAEVETLTAFKQDTGFANIETLLAQAKGVIIEGTYKRGPIV